jgi:hypothetical protein
MVEDIKNLFQLTLQKSGNPEISKEQKVKLKIACSLSQ